MSATSDGVETTVRQSRHLRAEIETEDAPAALSDEDADLAGPASDFQDWIADRLREHREQLTIAWFVAQLIEKSRLVLARNQIVRGLQLRPFHTTILVEGAGACHRVGLVRVA